MGDGDELTAASGSASDQSASDAARLEDLSSLTARLEAQLHQADGEPTEPARSRFKIEALLTARSVVTKWLELERSSHAASDPDAGGRIGLPITQIEPSWIGSPLSRVFELFDPPMQIGPSSDAPVVHRVLPDRHLDGVEELKASYARHAQALESLNNRVLAAFGPNGAQMLVDEILHRLEIERISQVRDSWSLVKRTEPSRVDPSLPPWLLTIDQVRQGPPVDWAIVADAELWPRLSTRDRAEAVSDRVRSVLDSAPEHAVAIQPSGVVNATNGDFGAWQKFVPDPPKADDWWQNAHMSSSLPHGTLFASRSDLTPAERADRDFLRGKWNDIERSRRELRIAHALATMHPEDSVTDREAKQRREARQRQLNDEERDVVAALQKYSVMPRRSLTDAELPNLSVDAESRVMCEPNFESTAAAVRRETPECQENRQWSTPSAHSAGAAIPELKDMMPTAEPKHATFSIRASGDENKTREILRELLRLRRSTSPAMSFRKIGEKLAGQPALELDTVPPPSTVSDWHRNAEKWEKIGKL